MYAGESDVYTDLLDITLRSLGAHPYGNLSLGLILAAFELDGAASFNEAVLRVRGHFEPLLEHALKRLEAAHG
jgi:hypothetical protein